MDALPHRNPDHGELATILTAALENAAGLNANAAALLISAAESGTLDDHMTDSALNSLANLLLEAVLGNDHED